MMMKRMIPSLFQAWIADRWSVFQCILFAELTPPLKKARWGVSTETDHRQCVDDDDDVDVPKPFSGMG